MSVLTLSLLLEVTLTSKRHLVVHRIEGQFHISRTFASLSPCIRRVVSVWMVTINRSSVNIWSALVPPSHLQTSNWDLVGLTLYMGPSPFLASNMEARHISKCSVSVVTCMCVPLTPLHNTHFILICKSELINWDSKIIMKRIIVEHFCLRSANS